MIDVPEYIRSLTPYIPGKPVAELERELGIRDSIKLASNENPLGPSPLAVKAINEYSHKINMYPHGDCYYLREKLAGLLSVKREEIIFGNGSNEIIEIIVRTFLRGGDEAIVAHPSFVVYSMVVQAAGGKNIVVPLREWRHDLQEMASHISEKTRLIFIASPNNPTGTINTQDEMQEFMDRIPGHVIVVVDQAYYEYVTSSEYPECLSYFRDGKNIIILRTFSKIYGLAGLRIGYGIAREDIIDLMNRIRQPFNVNSLAQIAALFALDDHDHIERSRRINSEGKRFLYSEFTKLGLNFVETEANFIYVYLNRETAHDVYRRLLQDGVIVRPMGPSALRITIGLPHENERLIQSLRSSIDIC